MRLRDDYRYLNMKLVFFLSLETSKMEMSLKIDI
jgi:hypothetical protein